jgi:hypothetical protein
MSRTNISASIIALMIEAVRASETSLIFNVTTRRYISEDSKLHNRRRESLRFHISGKMQQIFFPIKYFRKSGNFRDK